MNQSKTDSLKQYSKLVRQLVECFGCQGEISKLMKVLESAPLQPEITQFTAYRVIMLSPGLESECGGWKKAQLDWDRITEANNSWSRSLAGAKYYANKNSIEKYQIMITAQVMGFHLSDYALQVAVNLQALVEICSLDEIMSVKNWMGDTAIDWIHRLKKAVSHFEKEDEIVGVKVLDYKIIENKYMADDVQD